MPLSQESAGQSYQKILNNQDIDPAVGPDDYFFTRRSAVSGIDLAGHGEWYAIPRTLSVENPFTGENEHGTLRENGAFISDASKIAGHNVEIDSRVVILGASQIEDARIRKGAVVHEARISGAEVGRNTVIAKGAAVRRRPQSFEGGRGRIEPIYIDHGVVIGEKASVTGETHIAPNCIIGAKALVHDSYLMEGVILASASPEGPPLMRDQCRADWTIVARSRVGSAAMIGANDQIEKSVIGAGSTIGDRSDLKNVTIEPNEIVPADTIRRVEDAPAEELTLHETPSATKDTTRSHILVQRLRSLLAKRRFDLSA